MADTDARPVDQEALVADIDRTRAELARTIDAISDRVSPKRNVNRTMGEVRQRANRLPARQPQSRAHRLASASTSRSASASARSTPWWPAAAAAAVLVGVTVLFLVRRRRR